MIVDCLPLALGIIVGVEGTHLMVASSISACCLSSSLFASALALLPFPFPLPLLPPLCIVRLAHVSPEPCRVMLKHCYLACTPPKQW